MFKKIIEKFKKKKEQQKEVIHIESFEQLRLRNKETKNLDVSGLPKNTNGKDIQTLNLENKNLEIDIRKIWIPYDRESVYIKHEKPKDVFIHLNHTNLKGNHVTGNLSPIEGNGPNGEYLGRAYYWYNEETFDETYKENYPEYFLDKNAPIELKEKFYNPKIIESVRRKLTEIEMEKDIFLERQTLTFKEYCKYYTYLRGKYLGKFKIDKKERAEIAFVDYFGLEEAKEIVERLSSIDLSLEEILKRLSGFTKEEPIEELVQLTRERYKNNPNCIK